MGVGEKCAGLGLVVAKATAVKQHDTNGRGYDIYVYSQ